MLIELLCRKTRQKETPNSPMNGGQGVEVSKTLFYAHGSQKKSVSKADGTRRSGKSRICRRCSKEIGRLLPKYYRKYYHGRMDFSGEIPYVKGVTVGTFPGLLWFLRETGNVGLCRRCIRKTGRNTDNKKQKAAQKRRIQCIYLWYWYSRQSFFIWNAWQGEGFPYWWMFPV